MRFFLVWFGQLVSLFGSALTAFALDVWVFERTGSISQFALTVLFFVLPRLLLSPFAGSIVDRWDRRKIMLLADVGSAVGTALVAALLFAGQLSIWHVFVYNALNSSCAAFQRPAYSASIALLVPPAQMGRANGLRQLARSAADLLAPPAAGVLFGLIGLHGIVLIDLVSFLVGATCLACVRFPAVTVEHRPMVSFTSLLHDLLREAVEGWRFVMAQPGLRRLNLMVTGASLLGVTTEVLVRPYVLSTASSAELGWVVSAEGAGLLIGGVLLGMLGAPRRVIVGLLTFELLVSLCTIMLGLRLDLLRLAAIYCACFIGISLSDGCSELIWQTRVPPGMQGRIFALRDMLSMAAFALGLAIVGPLAEFVLEPALQAGGALTGTLGQWMGVGPGRGIALIFVMTGVFNIAVVIWAALHPALRALDSPDCEAISDSHIQSAL